MALSGFLARLFGNGPTERAARSLYESVVAQARTPGFYLDCAVPDDTMGRFEMIALHAFLAMRRLGQAGEEEAKAVSQALFDLMFADMDRNLREMGVSDIKIGKKVKELVKSFYGRIDAYDRGLADSAALEAALSRNLYGSGEPEPRHLAMMAAYVRRETEALKSQPIGRLVAGEIFFGPPPGKNDI